jgi:uncharacterized SAM-binding protein YcdF (DUF218 family)
MFIYLSKIIPPLLYPLGLVCLMLLAGLLSQRKPRLQRWLFTGALLLLWLASTRLPSTLLVRGLETRYTTPASLSASALEKGLEQPVADAIVILGGGTSPAHPPRPIPEMGSSGDRVIYAAYLYKHGAASNLLISSGRIEWLDTQDEPTQDMLFLLEMLGVPEEAVWFEDQSRNTYENAVFSQKILAEHNIQRIILVTSASHMPRAVGLFEKVGLQVIPAPTDFALTDADLQQLYSPNLATQILNWLPSPSNLELIGVAIKEYLGIFVYRLRGWI